MRIKLQRNIELGPAKLPCYKRVLVPSNEVPMYISLDYQTDFTSGTADEPSAYLL